jgi:hypothetical protein
MTQVFIDLTEGRDIEKLYFKVGDNYYSTYIAFLFKDSEIMDGAVPTLQRIKEGLPEFFDKEELEKSLHEPTDVSELNLIELVETHKVNLSPLLEFKHFIENHIVDIFATRETTNEALQYAQELLKSSSPEEREAATTTAIMVYHNTLCSCLSKRITGEDHVED